MQRNIVTVVLLIVVAAGTWLAATARAQTQPPTQTQLWVAGYSDGTNVWLYPTQTQVLGPVYYVSHGGKIETLPNGVKRFEVWIDYQPH